MRSPSILCVSPVYPFDFEYRLCACDNYTGRGAGERDGVLGEVKHYTVVILP